MIPDKHIRYEEELDGGKQRMFRATLTVWATMPFSPAIPVRTARALAKPALRTALEFKLREMLK